MDAKGLGHDVHHGRARTADVRVAGGHRYSAVLVDVHVRARLAADVEPEAAGDAATLTVLARRVVRMGLGGLERFLEADAAERRPVSGPRPLPRRVLEPERDGVDVQFTGEFVDHRFDPERGDRRAGRPVGVALGPVRHHVVADHLDVVDGIGGERAIARRAHRRTGECAGLETERGLGGHDSSVAAGADPDRVGRSRGRPGRAEHLLPRHHHLHRRSRLARERIGQRFQVDDGLAAESAANLRRNRPDVGQSRAGHLGGGVANHELALARTPDRCPPVRRHADKARVRLDVPLVDGTGLEVPLDDHIGLGKAVVHVAEREGHAARDVGRRIRRRIVAVRAQEIVHDRCVGAHRLVDVDDPGQWFVVDVDEFQRGFSGLCGRRRHCRDGMARVECLVARHDVAADEAHVGRADLHRRVEREVHQVGTRHHGLHPGRRRGPVQVDRSDACMGMRAAQHLAPEHSRLREIGAERRPAGHLVFAIRTDRALADPLVFRFAGHLKTPHLPRNPFLPQWSIFPGSMEREATLKDASEGVNDPSGVPSMQRNAATARLFR